MIAIVHTLDWWMISRDLNPAECADIFEKGRNVTGSL